MDKIHKLGELPKYLRKKQNTELKFKDESAKKGRPATFPRVSLKKESTLISNAQFDLSPKAVDKIHKLGHLPSYLKKKLEEKEVLVTNYDEEDSKSVISGTKTPIMKLLRQDTTSTIFSRISIASSFRSTRIGMSKSFDPNQKPRFNSSGKHPLSQKEKTQDDFFKNYKRGEVPKYLRNRLSRKRCNSPETTNLELIHTNIETIGDVQTTITMKSLDDIHELSEKSSKESDEIVRPNTVSCVEELKINRNSSKMSFISNKSTSNEDLVQINRHSECFKAKNIVSSLIDDRLHKLGFKPKYLRESSQTEKFEEKAEIKVLTEKIEQKMEINEIPATLEIFNEPNIEEKPKTQNSIEQIDHKMEIVESSDTLEAPIEQKIEEKLSRDGTFILIDDPEENDQKLISPNIENNFPQTMEDVDIKNNVSHPAAVVDISPKLDPLEFEPNILVEHTENNEKTTQHSIPVKGSSNTEIALEQLKTERDTLAKQLKFERKRLCGRDKAYKDVLERYKDTLKQFDWIKRQQKEQDVQLQQMKNQLRESRERNAKVMKEKSSLILDLKQQRTKDTEQLEILETQNAKLKCEVQQIKDQFHAAKFTYEQRLSELLAAARYAAPPIKSENEEDEDNKNNDNKQQIKCKSKHLKLMENEYEKMCAEHKQVTQQFEEMRKRYSGLCEEMVTKNEQIVNLKHQVARKNLKLNEMMNSFDKGMLLIDRVKSEIYAKLDKLRVYYTTLTYKEAQIDKLEARCIEALAYDERMKIWLEKLDEQLHQLKKHKKSRD